MAQPATKIHLERVRHLPDRTITGTLCNRMSDAGSEINSTDKRHQVTCKFCLKLLAGAERRSA